MHLPRVNVTEGLATMAVVAMLLAWSANADAMPPMRAALVQAVHAGLQDEEEYAEEYAEEVDSGEESDAGEYADEEYESGEEAESDSGEYAEEAYESSEDVAADGDEYVDEEGAELLDDDADDSWAAEFVEDDSDDAIPVDDETWGEDVAWDVIGEEAVDEEVGADDADEDVVGGGELALVRPSAQGPASKAGTRPSRSQASRPARGPGQWGTQGKGRRTKGADRFIADLPEPPQAPAPAQGRVETERPIDPGQDTRPGSCRASAAGSAAARR